ncbi:hypothetical protein LXA43DRAFT_976824 [Ganoderma leucocontextum]|nr:hypothetical protein LXA43DRAFT_976824 [Ganoderma leucocontextum]
MATTSIFPISLEPTAEPVVEEKTALLQELESEDDLYIKCKKLARHLEMLYIQGSYIRMSGEPQTHPIRAPRNGQFLELIDQHASIVGSTTGSKYVVRGPPPTLERLVDILPPEADSTIAMLGEERPDVTYQHIGGINSQKQEIREAVEFLRLVPEDWY